MSRRAKHDLNIYDRLDRIENAISAILEKLKFPDLEEFQHKPALTAAVTDLQQLASSVAVEAKPYVYERLDPQARQIRLLELKPMKGPIGDEETIEGTLRTYSLDMLQSPMRNLPKPIDLSGLPARSDPQLREEYKKQVSNRRTIHDFIALSYTWGEPVMDTPIYVDGKLLVITQSLKNALSRMSRRITAHVDLWWIDQICAQVVE